MFLDMLVIPRIEKAINWVVQGQDSEEVSDVLKLPRSW
jgi:hypothetical protein